MEYRYLILDDDISKKHNNNNNNNNNTLLLIRNHLDSVFGEYTYKAIELDRACEDMFYY